MPAMPMADSRAPIVVGIRVTNKATSTTTGIACAFAARPYNHDVPHDTKVRVFLFALTLIPFLSIALLLILSRLTRSKWTPLLIALVVVGESIALFVVPTLSAPTSLTIDYAPINYLLAHPISGDVYTLERDRFGRHGSIMKYNLSTGTA